MISSDVGVSNARTALAWQRTALALMAGAAIMARFTYSELGWAAIVVLMAALLLSAWVFVESRGRYSHHAGIRSRGRSRGGRGPGSLAIATLLIAGTELLAMAR